MNHQTNSCKEGAAPVALCSKVCTLIGAILFMVFLGTTYIMGAITPYIASYYSVENS